MDITAETINKVLEISNPELHPVTDDHGISATFSSKKLIQVKAAAPALPEAVSVLTLAGFADLVRAKLEEQDFPSDFLIHVEDHETVSLKARMSDDYGRRKVLITAKPVDFQDFRFGQWLDQEAFAIAVASLFADGGHKDYVLKMAATLTNEATRTSEDDGFTQRVNVKAGIRTKEDTTLQPRVDLAPYRTFPEVPQPVSPFVFRARCTGEGTPSLMLVEADGGRWKVDAIATLRQAMEAFGLKIPIIA